MTSRRMLMGWRLGACAALIALFLCATAGALATLWNRHLDERAMDRVAVVVDGAELAQWSQATGQSMDTLLQRLRQVGVTGVGVHEWTLQDAAHRGEVFILSKATLEAMDSPLINRLPVETPNDALVIGWTDKVDPWLARALAEELPHVALPLGPSGEGALRDEGLSGEGVSDKGFAPQGADDGTPTSLWLLVRSNPAFIVLGLHPAEIEAVQKAGLLVVPRLQGDAHQSPERLARRLEALGGDGVVGERFGGAGIGGEGVGGEGVGPVIFKGTSVLGFPHSLPQVAEALAKSDLAIGLIEFSPQHGFGALAKAVDYNVVRVHSITDREMAAGIAPQRAVDRWLRAVRERQIRLLYVRLYQNDQEPSELTAANLEYLGQLTTTLRQAGYQLVGEEPPGGETSRETTPGSQPNTASRATSHMLRPSAPPASIGTLALIALAVGACAGWVAWVLITRVTGLNAPAFGGVFLVLVGGASLLTLGAGGALWLKGYTVLARQSLALLTAISFPVASVYAAVRFVEGGVFGLFGIGRVDNFKNDEGQGLLKGLLPATKGFAIALAITIVGATFVAALLSDVRFLLKIEEFRGVKLAHLAPLVVLAVILAASVASAVRRPEQGPVRAFGAVVRFWMNRSIRLWELGVVLGAGLVLWVYLVRTGNQGLPVPAVEEALRRLLEENLYARPRTKEILIGHPALVAALACWGAYARSQVRWRRLASHTLLLAGAVGQISIVNTFAHAHSALTVSVARTFYGAILGFGVGVIAVVVIAWIDGMIDKAHLRRGRGGATLGTRINQSGQAGPGITGGAS